MSRRGSLLGDRRGTAAIEFALIAPIFVLLLLVLAESVNILLAAGKTQDAAESIADLVAQEKSVGDTEMGDLFHAGELILAPLPAASFGVAAASVRFDAVTGAPKPDWQATLRAPAIADAATLAAGLGGKGESVVVVRAQFDYVPLFGTLLDHTVRLTRTAIARPRLRPYVPYS
jgi:Flp pilus assembly protein TadG